MLHSDVTMSRMLTMESNGGVLGGGKGLVCVGDTLWDLALADDLHAQNI